MKEHPILFSTPMVRAIMEGRKTQTRRVVKPQPPERPGATHDHRIAYRAENDDGDGLVAYSESWGNRGWYARCPYGQPGDRLWVRESLGYDAEWGHYFKAAGKHGQITYLCELFDDPEAETGPSYDESLPDRGVPCIHLPRRYSRITLEVTGVRVERLRAISEGDAIAEGVQPAKPLDPHSGKPLDHVQFERPHVVGFASLWNEINGAPSWDANPWVWVVEFKRIEQERMTA